MVRLTMKACYRLCSWCVAVLNMGRSKIRPRLELQLAIFLVHLLAGLALCLSALQWPWVLPLLLVVAASCRLLYRRYGSLQDSQSVMAIKWMPDGVELELLSGQRIEGAVTGAVMLPWLLVLGVRCADSRQVHRVILLKQSCTDSNAWRHLRVLLLHSWRKLAV